MQAVFGGVVYDTATGVPLQSLNGYTDEFLYYDFGSYIETLYRLPDDEMPKSENEFRDRNGFFLVGHGRPGSKHRDKKIRDPEIYVSGTSLKILTVGDTLAWLQHNDLRVCHELRKLLPFTETELTEKFNLELM